MKKKINLALWRWLASKRESGFTLPFALMLGVIMILLGVTMVTRSRDDRVDAVSQKKTEKVRAVVEGGIDRKLTILNQARLALVTDVNEDGVINEVDWKSFYPINSTKTVKQLFEEAYPHSDKSTAEIVSYSYSKDSETATLVVKALLNDGFNTQTQVKITIPVQIAQPDSDKDYKIAALMAKHIQLKKSDVIGNILCLDTTQCKFQGNSPEQLLNAIEADKLAITRDSEDPSQPSQIEVGTVKMPDVPDIPSKAKVNDLDFFNSDNLGNGMHGIVLPRPDDQAYKEDKNSTPIYYYEVNNIDQASILVQEGVQVRLYVKGDINLKGSDVIAAYVEQSTQNNTSSNTNKNQNKNNKKNNKNQDTSNQGGKNLELRVPEPGQIKIYGVTKNDAQKFLLGGNSCIMAFIHAPKAHVGTSGGGAGVKCKNIFTQDSELDAKTRAQISEYEKATKKYPNIYGVVWANTYQEYGNNSNASAFWEQPGLIDQLGSTESKYVENLVEPKIFPPNSWTQEAVN